MACWLSWLSFSSGWCWNVLSQAIGQQSTFLDVTGWRVFVFCAYISEVSGLQTVITIPVDFFQTHCALFAIAINTVAQNCHQLKGRSYVSLAVYLGTCDLFSPKCNTSE